MNAQGAQWDCKCIPVNAQGDQRGLYCLWRWTRSPAGLNWCMCVCVREVKADLGAGLFFYIPNPIFYMLYSIYMLCVILNSICCILYFVSYILIFYACV